MKKITVSQKKSIKVKKTTGFSVIMNEKDNKSVDLIIKKINHIIDGIILFDCPDFFKNGIVESQLELILESKEYKELNEKYYTYFDEMLIEKLISLFDETCVKYKDFSILEEVKDRLQDTNPNINKMAKRFVFNYITSVNNNERWCDLQAVETALELATKNKKILKDYLSEDNDGSDLSYLETFLT